MSFIKFHCAYCWKDTCECTYEEQKTQDENMIKEVNIPLNRKSAKIPLEAFDIFKQEDLK